MAAGTPDHMHGRPDDARAYAVDLQSLATIRHTVALNARRFGLADGPTNDLVLVANELATNVVRHGGGTGELWMWRRNGCVYCRVTDHGPGLREPQNAGHELTDPNALTGRGLWLIRQMIPNVAIDTGADGTTVTVSLPVVDR
jgi:anti-sigma regulatory factor (Ser/Thr protein kinase)